MSEQSAENGEPPRALWCPVTECGCNPASGMHAVTCDFWPLYVVPSDPPEKELNS